MRAIEPSLSSDQPKDLRVIDVKEGKVIIALPNCQYTALSYVWQRPGAIQSYNAHKESSSNLMSGPPDLSRQPQTIADSIAVCSAIGKRYLWVEALCINQSDLDDLRHQVGQMDRISIQFCSFHNSGGK